MAEPRWQGRPLARWMRIVLWALAIVSLVSGVRGALGDIEEHGGPLWDLDYYRQGAANWDATGDPYLVDGRSGGYFYSPTVTPLFATVFREFEADGIYSLLVLVGIGIALLLSIRAFGPPRGDLVLCTLYAAAFANGEGIQLFVTGNLAWVVALLQAGALFAASRRRWRIFYLLVGLSCFIKPYSLALLVVPFILRALSPWALLSCLPLIVDFLGGLLLWPQLAASRMEAIRLQVIEPLQLRYSLAGRLSRVLADMDLDATSATAIAVAVQLLLAAGLAVYLRRRPPTGSSQTFAFAALAALAAIPRQVGYDAFAFGPALFVGLWTFAGGRGSRVVETLLVAMLAAGLFKEGLVVLPILLFALVLAGRSDP